MSQRTISDLHTVTVVNLRVCKDFGTREGDVRIDRRTKWGNPFKITKSCTREQTIQKYEYYFAHNLLKDINELKDARRLGCWCKPLACHGDVIRKYLENL